MSWASWAAVGVFSVAAFSDSVDGFLARRYDSVTKFGQVLDPLADKLLIGSAMVVLAILRRFPVWAVVVIVAREVAISVLRSAAYRRGKTMPAGLSGKIKTASQVPMVLIWIFPREGAVLVLQNVALYLAVALTLFSGFQYMLRSRRILGDHAGVRA